MKISNYDQFEYDYSTYWNNRNYEHFAEILALKKLFRGEKGSWFVDIGGSFGRHLPMYYNSFANPVIVDFSLNTLINNKERVWEKYPNTSLIAANVYFLPFKENVFDGSLMIRVTHHLDDLSVFYNQLSYVLKNKAFFIQEFANKVHIKAVTKNTVKGNLKFFKQDPYQQPSSNFEGSHGEESIFLNFHPKYILHLANKVGFFLTKKISVSFLRIGIIKKIIPLRILLKLESMGQALLGKTNLAPSIIYKYKLTKDTETKTHYTKLEDILVCPRCKGALSFKAEECTCTKCKNKYERVAQVWDFRVQ